MGQEGVLDQAVADAVPVICPKGSLIGHYTPCFSFAFPPLTAFAFVTPSRSFPLSLSLKSWSKCRSFVAQTLGAVFHGKTIHGAFPRQNDGLRLTLAYFWRHQSVRFEPYSWRLVDSLAVEGEMFDSFSVDSSSGRAAGRHTERFPGRIGGGLCRSEGIQTARWVWEHGLSEPSAAGAKGGQLMMRLVLMLMMRS